MTPRRPFHWSDRPLTWRQSLLLLAVTLVLLATIGALSQLKAQSAACFRHGVPAVCRSPAIEQQAKAIVMRQCPHCDPRKVTGWIYSYQMNRGPYANAAHLAVDVLQQVKP